MFYLCLHKSLNFNLFFRRLAIGTKDGTAKSGKDFKGKSQSQVQFNPGQTKRTWKVKILQVAFCLL